MGHSAALVSSSSNALSIVTAAVVAISAVSATYHAELSVGKVYGTITAPAVDVVVSQEKKCKGMGGFECGKSPRNLPSSTSVQHGTCENAVLSRTVPYKPYTNRTPFMF